MSVRGQGRGRGGRGRAAGRGRRRSPGTMIWEWENYSPGPDVYDSIFHVREAPPTITPTLPDECPLPILQAESRILDRRETDDELKRWYYVVLMRAPPSHPEQAEWQEKKKDVDISRILRYVSPRELERFENARFREEAEVEAVVKRAEEGERAKRRLMRNERPPAIAIQGPVGHGRGRGRGRARGRGRGRGQLGRGRVAVVVPRYHPPGKTVDEDLTIDELAESEGQPDRVLFSTGLQRTAVADTDSEQEQSEREQEEGNDFNVDLIGTTSPFAPSSFVSKSALPLSATIERMSDNEVIQETEESEEESPLMRSSFIANSALPISPPMQRTHHIGTVFQSETSEDDEMGESYAASQQLVSERLSRTRVREVSEESADETMARHPKRRRTESVASLRSTALSPTSPIAHSTLTRPVAGPVAALAADVPAASGANGAELRNETGREGSDMEGGDEDDEEYAVEAILSHTYQDGVKFYLVKWEGYGEATDWLPEEDLEGAREMVAEYDEKVRRKKGKKAVR